MSMVPLTEQTGKQAWRFQQPTHVLKTVMKRAENYAQHSFSSKKMMISSSPMIWTNRYVLMTSKYLVPAHFHWASDLSPSA